jgi:GNAT superfamily N-acetyltransferase
MTDPRPEIRLATAPDADFVRSGAARLAEHSPLDWLPEEATDRFAAAGCESAVEAIGRDEQIVLIAETAGESLGFLHAHLDTSAFIRESVGYISAVAATAEAAGRGVGRLLIKQAEQSMPAWLVRAQQLDGSWSAWIISSVRC